MDFGSRLAIRDYHIHTLIYGEENRVRADGRMTVAKDAAEKLLASDPLLRGVSVSIVRPEEHGRLIHGILDVIPISAKVLGSLGEGITHTLSGVYVLLTGADEAGHPVSQGGSCSTEHCRTLHESIAWGRAGTPLETDLLILVDVTLRAEDWLLRSGPDAAHRACDRLCRQFRKDMKMFRKDECTEQRVFQERREPGRKNVVLIKEVSGQGSVYDTHLFPDEPAGFEGSRSIIDMSCLPQLLTPNEYRDGVLRAMD